MELSSSASDASNEFPKPEDVFFDEIIGCIEEILIDKEFQKMQQSFLEKYWHVFDSSEENKLIYTEIFLEYNQGIESFIDNKLNKRIPNFSMRKFAFELKKRKGELYGEVFEILLTFTDFIAFKEMLIDYKAVKEGKIEEMSVTSIKIV